MLHYYYNINTPPATIFINQKISINYEIIIVKFDIILSDMDKPPIRPIASFYIFLSTILLLVSALFTHLALVYNVKIFQTLYIDGVILLIIFIIFILLSKDKKIKIGFLVMPILLYFLVATSGKTSTSQLEKNLKEQEMSRTEQDQKIKSNPLTYTLVVSLIVVVLIGFIILNIYILIR